jgi:hypothetical protein
MFLISELHASENGQFQRSTRATAWSTIGQKNIAHDCAASEVFGLGIF